MSRICDHASSSSSVLVMGIVEVVMVMDRAAGGSRPELIYVRVRVMIRVR